MIRVKYMAIGVPVFLVLCLSAFEFGYAVLRPSITNSNNVAPAPPEVITIPYKVWIVSKNKDGGTIDIQSYDSSSTLLGNAPSMTLAVSRATEEAAEEGDDVEVTIKFLPKKVK
jgi:hypothetical protein